MPGLSFNGDRLTHQSAKVPLHQNKTRQVMAKTRTCSLQEVDAPAGTSGGCW